MIPGTSTGLGSCSEINCTRADGGDCTTYIRCSPSGRKVGNRWSASPGLNLVRTAGVPPDTGTVNKPAVRVPNTMSPLLFHVPPRPCSTAHRSITEFPPTSTIFKALLVKNPICLPSGDQNGYDAPSVPGSRVKAVRSSERTDKERVPVLSEPTTAMRLPSGEIAGAPKRPLKLRVIPSGGRIESTTG